MNPWMSKFMRTVIFLWLSVIVISSSVAAPSPNIIFILTDDQGYGDLGVFFQNSRAAGKAAFATPQLDQMAAQGMRLRHHYTGAPVCAPARASLLMGQHQGHCGVRDNQFDKALPDNHTLATTLRQAGYRTACIGKWGLQGSAASNYPGHPLRRGFDDFFGYLEHGTGHTYYHTNNTPLREGWNDVTTNYYDIYSTDLFTARAKKFVSDCVTTNPAQPFFLYLAYTAIHNPLQVPGNAYPVSAGTNGGLQWPLTSTPLTRNTYLHPAYTNATYDHDTNVATAEIDWTDNMKRYATMARRLDDGVGDLLQTLRDLNVHSNTLVVFSSDNGPANENGSDPRLFDSWGPFDGFKRDCWEGGVRVPTIAWWPGLVATNAICDFPSGFWDWLPTFADVAGMAPPAQSDGVSLLPSLTGTGTQRNRGYIYVEYYFQGSNPASTDVFARKNVTGRGQQQIIRLGDLVGIRTQITNHNTPLRLYNLTTDAHEDVDLAAYPNNAAMLAKMKNLLLTVRRPEPSATRPYDLEYLPPSAPPLLTNGLLNYSVYEGNWPWVPDFDALTPVRTGNSAGLDVSVSTRPDQVGVKFSGYLEVPFDAEYTFYLNCDSGAQMWLHDAHILDDDFSHTGAEVSASVRLKAGRHPFRLFYRHTSGGRNLTLQYASAGLPRQSVPLSAFLVESSSGGIPFAGGDQFNVPQNVATNLDVLVNDTDDGLPSPLTIVQVSSPMAGTATNVANRIQYTPKPGFLGEDKFTYTVSDGSLYATGQVRIMVTYQDGSYWFPFNQIEGLSTEEAGGGIAGDLENFTSTTNQWVPGRFGCALDFDGVDDVVLVPGFPGILSTNARTVAAWVKTTSTNSQAIVGWGVRSAGAKWSFILNGSGNLRQEVESGYALGTASVNNGQWHHVAVTFATDGSPNVTDVKFYVDGQPDALSGQSSRVINTLNGGDLMIGSDNQDRFFEGTLDEVRLYNRALSASEVSSLYAATNQAAQAWHRRYLGNAPENWSADDDGDGAPRLVEYALGAQPQINDAKAFYPKPEISTNRLQLHFPRRAANTHELNYTVQVSPDLTDWTTLNATLAGTAPLPQQPGFEEAIYQANVSLTNYPRLWMRLRVSLP